MKLKQHLIILGLMPLSVFADDSLSFEYKTRTIMQAQTGSRQIALIDVMYPLTFKSNRLWYLDVMAKVSTPNMQEANFGFGQRSFVPTHNFIWGTYGFVDILSSRNDNVFQQFTIGAEYLSMTWDFRVNGYIPFGKTRYKTTVNGSQSSLKIKGHDILAHVVTNNETISSGYDIEVGRTIPGIEKLRVFGAYYNFENEIYGPRLRFEYEFNEKFTLNASVQDDPVRNTQYFVGFSYFLGGVKHYDKQYPLLKRMMSPLVRDIDIIVADGNGQDELIEYKDTYFAVDNDAAEGGDGTYENPYSNLQEALNDPKTEGKKLHLKGSGTQEYDLQGETLVVDGGRSIIGNLDFYFDPSQNIPTNDALTPLPIFKNGQILVKNGQDIKGIILDGTQNTKAGLALVSNNLNIENVVLQNYENSIAVDILNGATANFNNIFVYDNNIGIHVKDSTLNLTDSELRRNQHGIFAENANVNLQKVDVENNVTGITMQKGSLNILQPEFIGNTTGINVSDATVSISDGYFTNGDTAIKSSNSELTLNAVNITEMTQSGVELNGGSLQYQDANLHNVNYGIISTSADIKLQNINLQNNIIGINGSESIIGLDNNLFDNNETSIISNNSTIDSNYNIYSNSAIAINLNNDNFDSYKDVFKNNQTAIMANNSELTFQEATFTENVIALDSTASTIASSATIYDNNAAAIKLNNSHFSNYSDTIHDNSTAIDATDSTINLNDTLIENNNVGLNATNTKATLNNVNFNNNENHIILTDSELNLDAVQIQNGGTAFTLNNTSLVLENTILKNLHQGIVVRDGSITINNTQFDNIKNNAITLYNSYADIKKSVISNAYHGISITSGKMDINDTQIINNRGNGIDMQTGIIHMNNSVVSDNGISGIRVAYLGQIHVNDSSINNNQVDGLNIGGATQLHLNRSDVLNNQRYGLRSHDFGDVSLINETAFSGNGSHQIYTTNGEVVFYYPRQLQGTVSSGGLGKVVVSQRGLADIIVQDGVYDFEL